MKLVARCVLALSPLSLIVSTAAVAQAAGAPAAAPVRLPNESVACFKLRTANGSLSATQTQLLHKQCHAKPAQAAGNSAGFASTAAAVGGTVVAGAVIVAATNDKSN